MLDTLQRLRGSMKNGGKFKILFNMRLWKKKKVKIQISRPCSDDLPSFLTLVVLARLDFGDKYILQVKMGPTFLSVISVWIAHLSHTPSLERISADVFPTSKLCPSGCFGSAVLQFNGHWSFFLFWSIQSFLWYCFQRGSFVGPIISETLSGQEGCYL